MQSTDTLKPADVIDILIRRRWFILIPLFLTLVAGIYYAFTAPRVYQATTLVMIDPQKVPKEFVRSVVTDNAEAMLSVVYQQIASPTNIERIIDEYQLMPKNRPDLLMEDVIDSVKRKVQIKVSRDKQGTDTFSISYTDSKPVRAMEITNALASNFIEADLVERESAAAGTNTFLEGELESVRKRLIEKEDELKAYRQQFMGELPEQLGTNLSVLQGLQSQLTAKEANLRELKSRLSEAQDLVPVGAADPNDIGSLRRQLAELMMRYTDNHPDVTRLKNRIKELENGAGADGSAGQAAAGGGSRRQNMLLREQAVLENQIGNLQSQIRIYQARVEETPKREQELVSLKRDYDNMDNLYKSLLKRKLESEISISMERKQKGEQFRVIDKAQIPKKPIEPDLKRIFMLTMAIGFGLGGGLAFLLEFLDSSYRRPEKVEEDFNIPVIATIPAIYPLKAVYRKRLELGLCSLFAVVIIVLIGAFSYVTLVGNDQTLSAVKNFVSI